MKSEQGEEQPHQPPPPEVAQEEPPPSTLESVNAETESPDDDLHFNSATVPTSSSKEGMMISTDEQPHISPNIATDDITAAAVVSKMSDSQPSNPTTEYTNTTTTSMLESERSNASYRGFMYRNRHGVMGSTGTTEDDLHLARLIHRDLPFSQSRNRVNVRHNHGLKILHLIRHDWFHVILRYPKGICLLFLLSIWTFVVIIFAFIYVAVDGRQPTVDCGLGKVGAPIQFGQSFAFSLETTTTGTGH